MSDKGRSNDEPSEGVARNEPEWTEDIEVEEAGLQDDEVQDDAIIGTALKWSAVVILGFVLLLVLAWWLMQSDEGEKTVETAAEAPRAAIESAAQAPPSVVFSDVTRSSGIDFVHENGAEGERFLPESMGGGAAFFDFDADGDQDLLLINSSRWHSGSHAGSASGAGATTALYENDGSGRFSDISAEAGANLSLYGTGVAVGDYDNDGYVDVFVSAVGSNRLLHNEELPGGRRRFRDVTATAGVAGDPSEWSSSATFFDADGDGNLDLFVGNYVRWSKAIDLEVNYTLTGVGRAYGPPLNYQGTFPVLYRNQGDGRFVDVSQAAGVRIENSATGEPVAKSLGVVPMDADGDGDIDLLVANDTVRNFYFRNRGDGLFDEVGELYGIAYGPNGTATGAMGIDGADYRNDGSLGFAIGNFANEMTSLYVSQGDPTLYADEATVSGIGAPSRRSLSFGILFLDYDLDGRLDLLQVNGHLEEEINAVDSGQHYRQPAQLFWNAGDQAPRTFLQVDAASLGDLAQSIVGRGSAYADIDADGDVDLVLLQTGDRPLLLKNQAVDVALAQDPAHNWLRVDLEGNGETSNRDALGARVELTAGGVTQRRQVTPSHGYQSQSELVLTFGLGPHDTVDELVVFWPDGARQEQREISANQVLTLRQDS